MHRFRPRRSRLKREPRGLQLEKRPGLCYVPENLQHSESIPERGHYGLQVHSGVSVTVVASIEVGTHTARLLMAQATGDRSLFIPLVRERRTIRLAEGCAGREGFIIGEASAARAAAALGEFKARVGEEQGIILRAVSTGVTRTAQNRQAFIRDLSWRSGVKVESISGHEEAALTAKGAMHALSRPNEPFVLFDLGGGSTEFVAGEGGQGEPMEIVSLPVGASVLTEEFILHDPPGDEALGALAAQVDFVLQKGLSPEKRFARPPLLIGTGGTVTTLAAMVHGIEVSNITPKSMNGMVLERTAIEALLARMVRLDTGERACMRGLDPERAGVIPAGARAVRQIMAYYGAARLTVCLSDILEGLLIDELEGNT